MKTFRDLVESNDTALILVNKYAVVIFINSKNPTIEIFDKNGNFTELNDGSVHKLIVDLWKSGIDQKWEDYIHDNDTPDDFDADYVVIDLNSGKLSKLEKEIKKLDLD